MSRFYPNWEYVEVEPIKADSVIADDNKIIGIAKKYDKTDNTNMPEYKEYKDASDGDKIRMIASVDAEVGRLQLKWQGTTNDATIVAYGVGYHDSNPQYQLPAITNNAVGPTGNIAVKTVGTTANAAYTLLIELHKDNRFYSSGQFTDPAAVNYPPYGVTP